MITWAGGRQEANLQALADKQGAVVILANLRPFHCWGA
jgi:hypothetical protein